MLKETQDNLSQDYNAFRRGDLQLTANERHQFGFRLANDMQLIFLTSNNHHM
ncbi:DUF5694 domain-containing protein [Bacillus sp. UNC322MFChir4.1]|uniref:DUF5694 domain-containing protein n=1 Tax=Bacillus sp. UNC322MFChir4.1 TaxID=1449045 RepID=UPI003FA4B0AD